MLRSTYLLALVAVLILTTPLVPEAAAQFADVYWDYEPTPLTAVPGEETTVTLIYRNGGPDDYDPIAPLGSVDFGAISVVSVESVPEPGILCETVPAPDGGTWVHCRITSTPPPTIEAGTQIEIDVVFIGPGANATLHAEANPSSPLDPFGNNELDIPVVVEADGGGTDLETILSLPAEVAPEATFTFDVTVRNNGPSISLPFTMIAFGQGAILSADPDDGCGFSNAGLLQCEGKGPLAPGQSVTITVTAQAPEQGEDDPDFIVQGRWLNSDQEDPVPGNDLIIDRIPFGEGGGGESDLSLDCEREAVGVNKTGGAPQNEIAVGQPVMDTCQLTNLGAAAAEEIMITGSYEGIDVFQKIDFNPNVDYHAGLTCDGTTCEGGSLAAGESAIVTNTFVAETPGELMTTYEATTSSDDTDFGNNTVQLLTTFFDADAPDIAITIDAPEQVVRDFEYHTTTGAIAKITYALTVVVQNLEEPTSAAYDLHIVINPVPVEKNPVPFDEATGGDEVTVSTAFYETPPECSGGLGFDDDVPDGLTFTCEITDVLGPEKQLPFSLSMLFSDPPENFTQEIVVTATPVNPPIDKDWNNHTTITEQVEIISTPEWSMWDPPEKTVVEGSTTQSDLLVPNTESTPQVTTTSISTNDTGNTIDEVFTDDGACVEDEATGTFTCTDTIEPGDVGMTTVTYTADEEGESELCAVIEPAGQEVCQTNTVEPERLLPDLFIIGTPITEDGGRDDPYVAPGEEYTLEVKAWNIGRATSGGSQTDVLLPPSLFAGDALVLDPLPMGCEQNEIFPDFMTCQNGPLAPGEMRVFLFNMRAPDEGVLRHLLDIFPDGLDEDETNHDWTSTIRVTEEKVAVNVMAPEHIATDVPAPGRVVVENRGEEVADSLKVDMAWSGIFETLRCLPRDKCDIKTDGDTATARLESLDPNEVVEFFYTLLAEEEGQAEMTVTATEQGTDIFNQLLIFGVTDTAPCTITKTVDGDGTPVVGRPFVYNITVAAGDDPIADVNLRDPLPQGLGIPRVNNGSSPRYPAPDDCEYTESGGLIPLKNGLECHFPLAAGEARTVPFFLEADQPGVATNIATACGLTADETIDAQDLDVRILPSTVDGLDILTDLGAQFNIETLVTNTGSEPAPDVEVNLGIGPAPSYVDERNLVFVNFISSDQCSFGPSESTATCSLGTLDPGESTRITLFAQAVLEGVNEISAIATSGDDREDRDEELIFSDSRETLMEWANTLFDDGVNKRAAAVDVYVDGYLVVDDLAPGAATAFMPVTLTRVAPRLEITAAAAPDNSDPLAAFTADLVGTPEDSLAFSERTLFLLANAPEDTLGLLMKKGARTEAADPTLADAFFVHASPDAPTVELRITGVETEIPRLNFGTSSDYLTLEPRTYRVGVLDAVTGEELHGFRFDLSGRAGQAVALVLSGRIEDGTLGLQAFDGQGDEVTTPVEGTGEVPAQFVLHGNYPNPFNPTTTLRFDLPEAAEVRVEVYNMLGRRMLVLPPAQVEAGFGRTLPVDASALASGVYLYRIVATMQTRTITQTGRMVMVK